MRTYIGIDDTDSLEADLGTGKLARRLEAKLPAEATVWGILAHQLPKLPAIPYTSHNSSACLVIDTADESLTDALTEIARAHILSLAAEGSDPGLCVATERDDLTPLMDFGRQCARRVVTQAEARAAASGVFLEGLGGTNDGVIGAAAAVGLAAEGWTGRFLEYRGLLHVEERVRRASDLEAAGVRLLSLERHSDAPRPDDLVDTRGWLRPYLLNGAPALPVRRVAEDRWRTLYGRRCPFQRACRRAWKQARLSVRRLLCGGCS